MSKFTILFVEDDPLHYKAVYKVLTEEGYNVIGLDRGDKVYNTFTSHKIDLCIFDIMLPGAPPNDEGQKTEGGLVLAKMILDASPNMPIIIATGDLKDSTETRAYTVYGVDNFFRKPINKEVLKSKVLGLLKKAYPDEFKKETEEKTILRNNDGLVLFSMKGSADGKDAGRCYIDGVDAKLTPTEFKVMELFLLQKGKVMTAHQIYESVHGKTASDAPNKISVCINKLRKKLSIGRHKDHITTITGLGYKYDD